MQRSIYILTILCVYLLFSSKSCENDSENFRSKKEITAIKDSIKQYYSSSSLSGEVKLSYTDAAMQKLRDFYDLVKIVADTSLEDSFRKKAGEMAKQLFISGQSMIGSGAFNSNGLTGIFVDQLEEEKIERQINPHQLQIDTITVIDPLIRLNDSIYGGRLQSELLKYPSQNFTSKKFVNKPITVLFYVTRTKKYYENDTIISWESLLGDIK